MHIEGKKITIDRSEKGIYEFFTTLNNFELLMPSNTEKFEVDGNSFLFALKGCQKLGLF